MRKFKLRFVVWLSRRALNKFLIPVATIAALTFLLTYDFPNVKTWTSWSLPLSGKTIVIDPGHGGPDGGAETKDGLLQEKNVNLALARYLRDYLQQAGAVVYMTRDSDIDSASPATKGFSKRKTEDLIRRAEIVREKKADIFVTIHLNSVPSSKWHGAQTFYYPQNEEGKRLAALIQEEIKSNLRNTDRFANTAPTLYLLKTLEMPSVLVEAGFLSNPGDAGLLADENYQKKFATAVYRGILRYTAGDVPAPTPF